MTDEERHALVDRTIEGDNYFDIDFTIVDEFPSDLDPDDLLARCERVIWRCIMSISKVPELLQEAEEKGRREYAPEPAPTDDPLIQRMIATIQAVNPLVTDEELMDFADGLSDYSKTADLCRYIDEEMVGAGWCSLDMAMSGHMCEVYAARSRCRNRFGEPLKPRSIQTALMRYYKKPV